MSKGASVLVLLGLFLATTTATFYYDAKTADKDYLLKQKQVYNLFYHISQPELVYPDQYKLGQAWNIEEKIDCYTDKEAVKEFLKFYQHGMLPKGEMFSVYYPKLMKESLALFRLFYYAKDFDTFFNTALWARIHMNEGTYTCALYQAVIHRPDTKYIQLPYPYEIYPYAFFNSEVLEKAKNAHLYHEIGKTGSCANCDGNSFIINGNYSGWYIEREYDTEMKLKYFIEDIGFSTFYFYFRQDSPFWLNSDKYNLMKETRGEEYLYGHKQIMARYYLERMANGLEAIEDFDWNNEFYPGYYPTMTYHNGLPFPQRPHWSKIPHYKYFYAREIQDYESRISAAIDLGYVLDAEGKRMNIYTDPSGLNTLGNIIEGNEDSCNKEFYGSIDTLGRKILGFNLEPKTPYQIIPSALESFASSTRDPAFYRLYKRICQYYFRYKAHLKPYTKDEIVCPGIKIESVAVDKLTTYFDDFDATISNGLLIANEKEAETFSVKVRQERLNHKPFTVHLGINSEKPMKVAIRMFLGPKYDGRWNLLDFTESYKYYYEIDNWLTDLTAGANKIERNSEDFYFVYPDEVPSDDTYKKIDTCLGGGENFSYKERVYGFPRRLLLPKGRRAGSQYQLFVFISPAEEQPIQYTSRIWGSYQFSKNSFGFPLDRPIEYSNFDGPNCYFKDVTIYHKYEWDTNATA